MVIKNVLVYGEDQVFTEGEIYIKEGQFAAEASGNDETVDGEGCFAIPGLIDIHFHGCVGDDFCDASGRLSDGWQSMRLPVVSRRSAPLR